MNTYQEIVDFLEESNAIEGVHSDEALTDAAVAWERATQFKALGPKEILELHKELMGRISPEIAGQFRKVAVRVGTWIAPNPGMINRLLYQWSMNHGRAKMWEQIKSAHVAFEKIHPFEDGNGRIGRIIMNWQCVKAGLPIVNIHVGDEQKSYYQWFK